MKKVVAKFALNFVYRNDIELLENPFKKSQDYFILQGAFATIFSLLTSGTFLSGFAIHLGMRDELISFISIMPSICGILPLFGSAFLERITRKKRAVIIFTIIARSTLCTIVVIPLFLPKEMQQVIMLAVTVVAFAFLALWDVLINKWFISVIPEKIRGRYFAVRQSFAMAVSVIIPLATGWFMDAIINKYLGFVVLYTLGIVCMVVEVYAYRHIDEPAVENMSKEKINVSDLIRIPLKNREFMKYVITLFFLYFGLYFSCSYTQTYMIRYLKLPYILINLISILPAVLQIFMMRVWGELGDKHGHRYVMNISIWFYAGEFLVWAIAPSSQFIFFMPAACIFNAAANSGFAIGAYNRRYMIIPEKGRIIYDGFFNAAIGLSVMIAPLLGGFAKNALEANEFIKSNIEFGQFRVLYILSFVGIILLQIFNKFYNGKSESDTGTTVSKAL